MEPLYRGAIMFPALGLHKLLVPIESQPAEIGDGLFGGAGLVARMVQILHAKDHLAALRTRAQPGHHERAHVPQVQGTRGTWRQSADVRPVHCRIPLRRIDFLLERGETITMKRLPALSCRTSGY